MNEIIGSLTLIDCIVVMAVLVVMPLAFHGSPPLWALAAGSIAVSFSVGRGPAAAALTLPYLALAGVLLWQRATAAVRPRGPVTVVKVGGVLAPAYAVVSAGALLQSRAGWSMLGIHEPIVELTSVHFAYAGAASLVMAGRIVSALPAHRQRLARGAVAVVAGAPPVVALGFVTSLALFQVGGAMLMTAGVWLIGAFHFQAARDRQLATPVRALLEVSALASIAPMILAVSWAAGNYWKVPMLSIPDMARTHGVLNAFGFVLCGLVGGGLAGGGLAGGGVAGGRLMTADSGGITADEPELRTGATA